MRFLACLTGLAGLAAAAPSVSLTRRAAAASGPLNVVYWGQNGGGTIENNDLSTYCTSSSGIDVIVLAFLYQFGQNGDIASGTIGQSCFISSSGEGQNCDALISAIGTCKSAGVKIILSLGGASSSYSLQSQAQAQQIGQYLWDAYGNSGSTSVTRPLGSNVVDGFDFDIELNGGSSQYYQYMISTLRSNFAKDSANTYYITGAPQCPIPEPNMGVIISNAQFDWLFVQFYNNNNYTVPCALPINGNAPFNYNNWTNFISSTPSKDAKIFLGVPASPLAANGSPNGATYYASPDQLAQIVADTKSDAHFGGIMMWSAGYSDSNVNDGCTYAQEVKHILQNGTPCDGSSPPPAQSSSAAPPPKSSSPPPTSTSSSPPSTGTGTVAQWGQCGGQGYTGPTKCVPPYTCVSSSVWWSACQ